MTEQDMKLTRLAAKAAGIEQEPVAYSYTSRITGRQTFSLHPKPPHLDSDSWDIKPLYTEPPKREWAGLTDEERNGGGMSKQPDAFRPADLRVWEKDAAEAYAASERFFKQELAALRQALEQKQEPAVEWEQELLNLLCRIHRDGGHYIVENGIRKAIDDADLRVAKLNAINDTAPQPKQEPVAWLTEAAWGTDVSLEKPDFGKSEWKAPAPKVTALYPTLPIREWQNLTEAEIRDIRKRNQSHDAFAHAIENKLKEKNT